MLAIETKSDEGKAKTGSWIWHTLQQFLRLRSPVSVTLRQGLQDHDQPAWREDCSQHGRILHCQWRGGGPPRQRVLQGKCRLLHRQWRGGGLPRQRVLQGNVGFFIANDAEEVRRANAFCKVNVGFFIANDVEEVRRANVFCKVNVGFFIANDAEEVRRANAFCKVQYIVFITINVTLSSP